MSWRPWSGVSSATTPRASRASALPELAEMDRLPCLATGTPAAAVRMALAVLTLKVVSPPPVPHMSVRFPSTFGWIWTQLARMARAMAATSSRSEEHTSELQSRSDLVCRLLLEKKKSGNIGLAHFHRQAEGSLRFAADAFLRVWPTDHLRNRRGSPQHALHRRPRVDDCPRERTL